MVGRSNGEAKRDDDAIDGSLVTARAWAVLLDHIFIGGVYLVTGSTDVEVDSDNLVFCHGNTPRISIDSRRAKAINQGIRPSSECNQAGHIRSWRP